jgi:hypothetical protein
MGGWVGVIGLDAVGVGVIGAGVLDFQSALFQLENLVVASKQLLDSLQQ